MRKIWQQHGHMFAPSTDSLTTATVPPAIYRYGKSMSGWFLETVSERFVFPYKIYGNHDHIVDRAWRAWGTLEGNLGILLNGIKGTGKSVTAQLLSNYAIDHGVPVIMVSHPIPLTEVLNSLEQDVVIVFDEFEKTHSDKDGEQQALLTSLDGMTRSAHKRMFLFTTNSKLVNENFIDRPSRIRYCWEFGRLEESVIEAILDDMLLPARAEFRADIVTYLQSRRVLSIDVVKTVIAEVNTFNESPSDFADKLNLSETDAPGFVLEIVDEDGNVVKPLARHFSVDRVSGRRLSGLLTKSGRSNYISDVLHQNSSWSFSDSFNYTTIEVVGDTDRPAEWFCHLRMPALDTWIGKYPKARRLINNEILHVDPRPEGWEIPEWVKLAEKDVTLEGEPEQAFDNWDAEGSVYGTDKRARFRVRITPSRETFVRLNPSVSIDF